MTSEEKPIKLEGIVKGVDLENSDLFVLIEQEDGILYNTVLRGEEPRINNSTKRINEVAMKQLKSNIVVGDKIEVSVIKDKEYTKSLPLYKVESQYRIGVI